MSVKTDSDRLATLSKRELEALVLLANGFCNKEIARAMAVSAGTANDFCKQIFRKLEVNCRTKAAVIAAKAGIV